MQLPRGREREELAPHGIHVGVEAVIAVNLLEQALGPRRRPQVHAAARHHLEHGRQRRLRRARAQALVRPVPVLQVRVHGAVEAHGVGFREDLGVAVSFDLLLRGSVSDFCCDWVGGGEGND